MDTQLSKLICYCCLFDLDFTTTKAKRLSDPLKDEDEALSVLDVLQNFTRIEMESDVNENKYGACEECIKSLVFIEQFTNECNNIRRSLIQEVVLLVKEEVEEFECIKQEISDVDTEMTYEAPTSQDTMAHLHEVVPRDFEVKEEPTTDIEYEKPTRASEAASVPVDVPKDLEEPTITELPDGRSKCSICHTTFKKKYYAVQHFNLLHIKENHPCTECSSSFSSSDSLKRHRAMVHRVINCRICFHSLTRKELDNHMLEHRKPEPEPVEPQEVFKVVTKIRHETLTTTKATPQQTTYEADESEHSDPTYHLDSADETDSTEIKIMKLANGRYLCSVCLTTFKEKSRAIQHINILHLGHRRFKCRLCGKKFARSSSLNRHLKVHESRTPYPCSECSMTFISADDLGHHIFDHSSDKKFDCEICSKSFNRSSDRDSHLSEHKDSQPQQCLFCSMNFKLGSSLRYHMRVAHNFESIEGVEPMQKKLKIEVD